ncbi:thiamine phosphate synthase [Ketobacter alkanivorans]|uniref:Thiamine-phosphate synthase n=1 Tax=Ketobacter alkanivorans TaxID=1917421 RepID=A0A2K9LNK5_9GAMM|nr:thiamine phosphate synthase [Ketobacter alkanivorans]AUM13918.1 thiamine phosphate synthase [Ketobacter alkanivorans]
MLRGLYAITDPLLTPTHSLLHQVQQALLGGARIIQYRDKTSPVSQRLQSAGQLRELTRAHGALLIINDDLDLCLEVNADGVHLGQEDTSLIQARQQLGRNKIIGATCHGSEELARKALDEGANYLAFGRFFPSRTKPDALPADLNSLRPFLTRCPVPTVAIGGITLNNAPQLVDAGFSMLAVINDLFDRNDTEHHCQQYAALFS